MPRTTQPAYSSPASSTRSPLIALIAGYDEALRLAEGSEPASDSPLRRHRRLGVLLAGPFLHALVVRHVNRLLLALTRRLSARAALAEDPRAHESDLALLGRYLASLPTGLWYRRSLLLVMAASFLLAYVLANHIFRSPEAHLLGDLTSAALTLDRRTAVDAVNNSTLENTGGAAVIALWSLWGVLLLPLVAFRHKRTLFGDRIYTLERDACAAVGLRPPRELPLDALMQAMLALSILGFGLGTILYGLSRPTGEQQLPGSERYIVGAACVVLAGGALVGIGAKTWQRSGTRASDFCRRLAGPLNAAVTIVFVALLVVAIWSR